ncbi:hypothetical protein LEMLEM_LOCUS8156 [Lemmus lemmus]
MDGVPLRRARTSWREGQCWKAGLRDVGARVLLPKSWSHSLPTVTDRKLVPLLSWAKLET